MGNGGKRGATGRQLRGPQSKREIGRGDDVQKINRPRYTTDGLPMIPNQATVPHCETLAHQLLPTLILYFRQEESESIHQRYCFRKMTLMVPYLFKQQKFTAYFVCGLAQARRESVRQSSESLPGVQSFAIKDTTTGTPRQLQLVAVNMTL